MNPRAVLVLGVTPETVRAAWTPETSILAVDASPDMIANVWRAPSGARAIQGDWRALPLAAASVDLVAGDGVTTVLAHPDEHRTLFLEARRVLTPGGRLVLRVFLPGSPPESPADVVRDLRAGRIRGFHAFKWRLGASLARSAVVRLGDVWNAWRELVPDATSLLAELGWSEELVATVDAYRDRPELYAFPAEDSFLESARDLFVVESRHVGTYELAERCPTLVLRALT
ncbi:MAG TPA: class I SAM-dependent methyltransferase [Polyangiaceae bacterium]